MVVGVQILWLSVGVSVAALVVPFGVAPSEPAVRLTGLFLQIIGVGTVAWGISETRALFGKPSMLSGFIGWLRRCPLLPGKTISGSLNVTLEPATMHARGYALDTAKPEANLEDRVDVIEKNLRRTIDRVDHMQREIDKSLRSARTELRREADARAAEDSAIRQRLELAGTGGIYITAMGALWLFLGVLLSTASPEIARWLVTEISLNL